MKRQHTLRKNKTAPNYVHYHDWATSKKRINILSREEWIQWWEDTGVFHLRGSGPGYCYMSRVDKELPFALWNIELKWKKKK